MTFWLPPTQLSSKVYVSAPNWRLRTSPIQNSWEYNVAILPPMLNKCSGSKHDARGTSWVITRWFFLDTQRTRHWDHSICGLHRVSYTELLCDSVSSLLEHLPFNTSLISTGLSQTPLWWLISCITWTGLREAQTAGETLSPGVPVNLFLKDISILIRRLSKELCPHQSGRASFDSLGAHMEQKGEGRENSILSSAFQHQSSWFPGLRTPGGNPSGNPGLRALRLRLSEGHCKRSWFSSLQMADCGTSWPPWAISCEYTHTRMYVCMHVCMFLWVCLPGKPWLAHTWF